MSLSFLYVNLLLYLSLNSMLLVIVFGDKNLFKLFGKKQ